MFPLSCRNCNYIHESQATNEPCFVNDKYYNMIPMKWWFHSIYFTIHLSKGFNMTILGSVRLFLQRMSPSKCVTFMSFFEEINTWYHHFCWCSNHDTYFFFKKWYLNLLKMWWLEVHKPWETRSCNSVYQAKRNKILFPHWAWMLPMFTWCQVCKRTLWSVLVFPRVTKLSMESHEGWT